MIKENSTAFEPKPDGRNAGPMRISPVCTNGIGINFCRTARHDSMQTPYSNIRRRFAKDNLSTKQQCTTEKAMNQRKKTNIEDGNINM